MPAGSFELPPTAGLPAVFGDFIRKPARAFTLGLQDWLGLPEPVIPTCSGTAALVVALKTLHQRAPAKNQVIIPAYTCPLVALAVKLVPGLSALPCDTVRGGIDLAPEALGALCSERTLAIVPAHLGGRVADLTRVCAIAKKCGALVIEDAAQAMGAFNHGVSVGLAGDAGFFSLAVGKGLSTYEGGVLFSRHPDLSAELAAMAKKTLLPDFFRNLRRLLELAGYMALYSPSGLRHAYGRSLRRELARGDEVRAVGDYFTLEDIPLHSPDSLRLRAAANALERLPAFLAQGRMRAEKYLAELRKLEGVAVVRDNPDANGVWPFFMALLPGKRERDDILRRLWTSGLGVSKLFAHALPDYAYLGESGTGSPAGGPEAYSGARDFAARMFTITNSPWLDEEKFSGIVAVMRESL
ncbi:MAG: DegT/DnrJ/EryC1/StrS family aminotransferase [Deltaproteobacteria bacterium]|nr:DegT/DnrJ/EryC1/StrS family aminotransferase [Deltaproteobacteria bacterium]